MQSSTEEMLQFQDPGDAKDVISPQTASYPQGDGHASQRTEPL